MFIRFPDPIFLPSAFFPDQTLEREKEYVRFPFERASGSFLRESRKPHYSKSPVSHPTKLFLIYFISL